jgi:hypothetical protein
MGHATLDLLIDSYLADMQRRECTEDSFTPWPTLWTGDVAMTALRQRYIDDLQLRNNCSTHISYLAAFGKPMIKRFIHNASRSSVYPALLGAHQSHAC